MTLAKILKGFLFYILRSVVLSVVIFIIGVSVFTQQFPPDIKKLQSFHNAYQQLREISSMAAVRDDATKLENGDIDSLLRDRKQLSEVLTKLNLIGAPISDGSVNQIKACDRQIATIDLLKEKLKQLDEANNDLNRQVLQLKYK